MLGEIGDTPLVPLGPIAAGLEVPILAKCEHLNPGGSVKDRIALAIVLDAERRGVLAPGDTIVEATAGNTGVGLALVAGVRGYRLVCVMPEKMSLDKRTSLAALGARVEIVPNAPLGHPDNFQEVARRLAAEHGWFLADQFCNPANPLVHEQTTGPEILAQAGGRDRRVRGGRRHGRDDHRRRPLPAAAPARARAWCSPTRSAPGWPTGSRRGVAGPDTGYLIEGIGAGAAPAVMDRSVIDAAERIPDAESFAMVGRLLREEGLLVGGSAGTAVAAAVRVARAGGLDGPVVALLPDSWDRYLSTAWLRGVVAATSRAASSFSRMRFGWVPRIAAGGGGSRCMRYAEDPSELAAPAGRAGVRPGSRPGGRQGLLQRQHRAQRAGAPERHPPRARAAARSSRAPRSARAAREHSADMLARGYFEHDGPKESFDKRIRRFLKSPLVGENIAWGTGRYASPEGIVRLWMHSPPHRRIILMPTLHRVGLGVAMGSFQGNHGAVMATADFSS